MLINKYAPKEPELAQFHKTILTQLQLMCQDDSVPHIIFYGPEGSGKKTIINMFLEMRYDKNVHRLFDCDYQVSGSGSSSVIVPVKQSKHHIIIEPNNNNFDRYLIQDVVKQYAKHPSGIFCKKNGFRTVLINNVDNLSYYAQTSLRRTMEQYSGACRFIMWSRSLSKVIEPLRSRCYCFKIPSPTNSEICCFLLQVARKEKINLSIQDFNNITQLADKNIKKLLWLLELKKFGETYETTYDIMIKRIISNILTAKIEYLCVEPLEDECGESLTIRDRLYKIMITNIDGTHIIKDIVGKLLEQPSLSFEVKAQIIECGAKYEHNLVRGRREIIHLEAFIAGTMMILHNNKILK